MASYIRVEDEYQRQRRSLGVSAVGRHLPASVMVALVLANRLLSIVYWCSKTEVNIRV